MVHHCGIAELFGQDLSCYHNLEVLRLKVNQSTIFISTEVLLCQPVWSVTEYAQW